MERQGMRLMAVAVVAGLGFAGLGAYHRMPSCEDRPLVHRLSQQIDADRHFDGVFVTAISTIGGRFFEQRSCRAMITALRGSVDVTDHPWTVIEYTSPISSPAYTVTGTALPPVQQP